MQAFKGDCCCFRSLYKGLYSGTVVQSHTLSLLKVLCGYTKFFNFAPCLTWGNVTFFENHTSVWHSWVKARISSDFNVFLGNCLSQPSSSLVQTLPDSIRACCILAGSSKWYSTYFHIFKVFWRYFIPSSIFTCKRSCNSGLGWYVAQYFVCKAASVSSTAGPEANCVM